MVVAETAGHEGRAGEVCEVSRRLDVGLVVSGVLMVRRVVGDASTGAVTDEFTW